MENYTVDQIPSHPGPKNPDMLLTLTAFRLISTASISRYSAKQDASSPKVPAITAKPQSSNSLPGNRNEG